MGEYSDMIMQGLICDKCGDHFEDEESPGYPRVCDLCEFQEEGREHEEK